MTHIDDALIAEADERRSRGSKITARSLMKNAYRWGSIAACMILAVVVLITATLSGQDVLLYGESIADSPRTVSEYMPLALAHIVETLEAPDVQIPLELEFKKETKITLTSGSMIVLDENGDTLCDGTEYLASGSVSLIITLPGDAEECIIETDRGYNIVLTQDGESHVWYVNIEK
jgi:hypothetical protein